jgi:hypothetical protein
VKRVAGLVDLREIDDVAEPLARDDAGRESQRLRFVREMLRRRRACAKQQRNCGDDRP